MINEERGYMTKIKNMIPKGAKFILFNFTRLGYETYLVGGCVRDIILDRIPSDWDICTSATPEQMINMVNYLNRTDKDYTNIKIIPTGLKHGTLTLIVNDMPFEVTTFRCDGNYSDNRRPDNVTFTKNLIEDLKRRDFTINAMAFSIFKGFIDPFDGIRDIKYRTIRCVGNPHDRFNEDGLRIMRAIRFSAQLGFTLEEDTFNATNDLVNNLDNISAERINSELCKMVYSNPSIIMNHPKVLCKIIPEFKQALGFNQNNPYHAYTVYGHTRVAMLFSEKYNDLIIRLALLFHDIGKPNCYQDDENGIRHFKGHGKVSAEMTNEIMRRLKFDNDTREKVVELVRYHDATFEIGKKYVKRWLNTLGEEQFKRLLQVRICDIKAQSGLNEEERLEKVKNIESLLDEVLKENECFQLKDLAINGKDLIKIGIPEGKMIGNILNQLLTFVIDGIIKNEKDELIKTVNLIFTI